MSKDPPPSYEDNELGGFPVANNSSNFNSSRYQALPAFDEIQEVEETAEDVLEQGLLPRQIEYQVKGSALVSRDSACVNLESLESLIRDHLPSTPPTFNLEIKGFKRSQSNTGQSNTGRRNTGQSNTGQSNASQSRASAHSDQAFSFTVPLPTPAFSIFYSMANDAPCLRGAILAGDPKEPTESGIGDRGWDRSACTSSAIYSSLSSEQVINQQSSESIREKWNNRVKKMMSPPWLSLNEPVRPRVVEMLQTEGTDLSEATSTLQHCLNCFIKDKRGSSRWLIGPQNIFGWEQSQLLEELTSLVEGVNNESEASRQDPITHLELQVQSPPPFFALHYQPPPHWNHILPTEIVKIVIPISIFSFISLLLFAIFSETKHWWILPSLIFLVFFFKLIMLFGDTPSTHDSIGVAWSMKQWVKMDVPISMSKKEAMEILKAQERSNGSTEEKDPQLKLSEGGWFKLIGMEESNWIDIHRERLKAAIRYRRNGNLTVEWPSVD